MQVGIWRVDDALPLPCYATPGSAGFDLYCRLDVTVPPGELGRLPANVIVAVPDGYALLVALRSSTPRRKGLLSPHGFGIIDRDYCGPDDEIQIEVYNFGREAVTIRRGERIAQGLLVPVSSCSWVQRKPENHSRGGFGSTG